MADTGQSVSSFSAICSTLLLTRSSLSPWSHIITESLQVRFFRLHGTYIPHINLGMERLQNTRGKSSMADTGQSVSSFSAICSTLLLSRSSLSPWSRVITESLQAPKSRVIRHCLLDS